MFVCSVYVEMLNRRQNELQLVVFDVDCFVVSEDSAVERMMQESTDSETVPGSIWIVCSETSNYWVNVSISSDSFYTVPELFLFNLRNLLLPGRLSGSASQHTYATRTSPTLVSGVNLKCTGFLVTGMQCDILSNTQAYSALALITNDNNNNCCSEFYFYVANLSITRIRSVERGICPIASMNVTN